jgi:hypothetical protein
LILLEIPKFRSCSLLHVTAVWESCSKTKSDQDNVKYGKNQILALRLGSCNGLVEQKVGHDWKFDHPFLACFWLQTGR